MDWIWLLATEEGWQRQLIDGIAEHPEYSYLIVFTILFLCGLGLPVPEELPLVAGGYAMYKANAGVGGLLLMILVCEAGVLIGDTLIWGIGKRVGGHPEKVPLIGRHLTAARMEQARELFAKYGATAVFFGRFVFGVRAVTFFVSGGLGVPLRTFLLMDFLASLISVPISVWLPWYFGGQLDQVFEWLSQGQRVLLVIVPLALGAVVFFLWRMRQPAPGETGSPAAPALEPEGTPDSEPPVEETTETATAE